LKNVSSWPRCERGVAIARPRKLGPPRTRASRELGEAVEQAVDLVLGVVVDDAGAHGAVLEAEGAASSRRRSSRRCQTARSRSARKRATLSGECPRTLKQKGSERDPPIVRRPVEPTFSGQPAEAALSERTLVAANPSQPIDRP
jgi:hypothetical protein